jgi:subtilase family serine protease
VTRMAGRLIVAPAIMVVIAGLASPALASPAGAASGATRASFLASVLNGRGHYVHRGSNGEADVNVCSDAVPAGYAHCDARVRTDVAGANVVLDNEGYSPAYLQSAYNAPSATNGAGQTVAIVDAFDDPTAEADLAAYRTQFGLPACTTANGCFRKVDEHGGTSYPTADAGWAVEISLDLDMVSAMCPNCHILLVEAASSSMTIVGGQPHSDLGTAVNTAVALGANVVSNSYGGAEFSAEQLFDTFYNHPGVAIVASSGDDGFGVEYPAASPDVVAVGGTRLLQLTATGTRNATETAWSGAGSGCSAYEPKPLWQGDPDCGKRIVADVSAVADPSTGVWVYDSAIGWTVYGGTSASAPIVGAMYALADNPSSNGKLASFPYTHTQKLNDVASGSNGSCGGSTLCTAGIGYDGPTGLGTPNTADAFSNSGVVGPPPPVAPDFSISAATLHSPLRPNGTAKSTVTITPLNGDTGVVSLAVLTTPHVGLTTTLAPRSVTLGSGAKTSTLTFTGHTGGTYTVTVTATQGTLTHTAQLSVVVNDFVLKVAAPKHSVVRGKAVRYTVTLSRRGNFAGTVRMTLTGLRARDKVSYTARGSGTPTITVTVTVKTSAKDARGTLSLHFNGVSGTLRHTTVVGLVLM